MSLVKAGEAPRGVQLDPAAAVVIVARWYTGVQVADSVFLAREPLLSAWVYLEGGPPRRTVIVFMAAI